MTSTNVQKGDQWQNCSHYWYSDWPDHKTPDNPRTLVDLAVTIEDLRQRAAAAPLYADLGLSLGCFSKALTDRIWCLWCWQDERAGGGALQRRSGPHRLLHRPVPGPVPAARREPRRRPRPRLRPALRQASPLAASFCTCHS